MRKYLPQKGKVHENNLCHMALIFAELSRFWLIFSKDLHCRHVKNDKLLDWTKLKAFSYNKIDVAQQIKSIFGRLVNIVDKGETSANYCCLEE